MVTGIDLVVPRLECPNAPARNAVEEVSVVDLLADQDIADLPVGVNPEAVLPSPDGSSVYVADAGAGTADNGSLKVISAADINVNRSSGAVAALATTPGLPTNAWPDALALDPSGDR